MEVARRRAAEIVDRMDVVGHVGAAVALAQHLGPDDLHRAPAGRRPVVDAPVDTILLLAAHAADHRPGSMVVRRRLVARRAAGRSEERSVGEAWGRTCRSGWSAYH